MGRFQPGFAGIRPVAFPSVEACGDLAISPGGDISHVTVQPPAGTTAGKMLICLFRGSHSTESGFTLAAIPGWTTIADYDLAGGVPGVGFREGVAYRVATGDSGDNAAVTGGDSDARGLIIRCSAAGVPSAGGLATFSDTSTHVNAGSFTPAGGSKKYLWLAVTNRHSTITAPPANYTLVTGSNVSGGSYTAWRKLEAASEDPGAFTDTSFASTIRAAFVIAIPPPAT